MGKGDKRSRKGKIHRGTFGKTRPRRRNRVSSDQAAGKKQ